jgi:PAS domain S-box-containing protein
MNKLGKPFPCTSICSSIMDSVADGVFTIDRKWIVTYLNRSVLAMLGLTASEAVGRKCWEVFQTRDCQDVCVLRACMGEDCRIAHRVMTIERRDGTALPVSVSAAPVKDSSGRIIGGVETLRALTAEGRPRAVRRPGLADEFITMDPDLLETLSLLPQVAESGATVLLLGESGTGKELVARAIHRLSGCHDGPFVAVNCGALPGELMESELFGYKAGAFTDARKDKPGRFELAQGGTLFLDEIGEMPLTLQAKILRVLQERVYEPLGGVESVRTDARVVASTNKDLAHMAEEGSFRLDLFYRLNVVQFTLPPLRQRLHDVPLLAVHTLANRRFAQGKDIRGFSPEVMRLLTRHSYPGNVRELENVVEYACILCPGGLIEPAHLPKGFKPNLPVALDEERMTMDEVRYQAAVRAVNHNNGNRNAACRELGITKDTLRRILRLTGEEKIVPSQNWAKNLSASDGAS